MNRPRYDGRSTLPFINDVSDSDVVIDKLPLTCHHKSNDLIVVRLRDKAFPDFFATTQNQYPIANVKNVVQIVRNENHSYPALFEFLDYS